MHPYICTDPSRKYLPGNKNQDKVKIVEKGWIKDVPADRKLFYSGDGILFFFLFFVSFKKMAVISVAALMLVDIISRHCYVTNIFSEQPQIIFNMGPQSFVKKAFCVKITLATLCGS